MIGDAAHATTPHIGNGAAQAIEDAAVLCALFHNLLTKWNSNHDVATNGDTGATNDNRNDDIKAQIPALFQAFDTVRRERSQRVVEMSRVAGDCYVYDFDRFLAFNDPHQHQNLSTNGNRHDDIEGNSNADGVEEKLYADGEPMDGDIVEKLREKWMKFATFTNDVDLLTQNEMAVEAFRELVSEKGASGPV
jgi:hypothetical protein